MKSTSNPLTAHDLKRDLTTLGLGDGDTVLVHSSLSALGPVDGGAAAVVEALLQTLGDHGTLVVPTFTPDIRDPHPDIAATDTRAEVAAARDKVPLFDPDTTPTPMGAIPQAVLDTPGRLRSRHPQVSIAAVGPHAATLCQGPEPLGYALDRESPVGRLVQLDAKVLLLGVGHNRSSLLHHVETLLTPPDVRRRKLRRFPLFVRGQRAWVEVPDVGDDNDTYFTHVGHTFEQQSATLATGHVGLAEARAFCSEEYSQLTTPALRTCLETAGRPMTPGHTALDTPGVPGRITDNCVKS